MRGAFEELIENDLIIDQGNKGEIFAVTDLDYQVADPLSFYPISLNAFSRSGGRGDSNSTNSPVAGSLKPRR